MTGGWDQATWKRVESEDELRAGMTVQLRGCEVCKASHRFSLTDRSRHVNWNHDHVECKSWSFYGGTCGPEWFCPLNSIAQRRLYSLIDTTPAEETTTTTRELEKVTG